MVVNRKSENVLYLRAGACFNSLHLALQAFEGFLQNPCAANLPVYYRARNHLRDAQKSYDEALAEAKRLLGPLSSYSAEEFEKWRSNFLSTHKIVVASQEYEAIRDELLLNDRLTEWMSREDIERLLTKEFESQKTGKRKLANIKVRLILDRLQELLRDAERMKKEAMARLPGTV